MAAVCVLLALLVAHAAAQGATPPALPTSQVDISWPTAPRATTRVANTAAEFQAALLAAQQGDEVPLLPPPTS